MKAAGTGDRIRELVAQTRDARAKVRSDVRAGDWAKAEPDADRLMRFVARKVKAVAPRGRESLQGPSVDFQGASFLAEGARVRRAIGLVEVNDARYTEVGSGFLISPGLLLTNQHVLRDADAARVAQVTFDRELDERRLPTRVTSFVLDPDAFAVFSDEADLDYALVAVGARAAGSGGLPEMGCCALSDSPDRHVIGMNVNIIQHPRGWPKMISVRNNLLTHRTPRTLLYETDTDQGSSGSPVFNDEWDLVALHHWGEPFLERTADDGRPLPVTVNEGVRISAIYQDLKGRAAAAAGAVALLEAALALSDAEAAEVSPGGGRTLSPARRPSGRPEGGGGDISVERAAEVERSAPAAPSGRLTNDNPSGASMSDSSHVVPAGGEIRFTVPVEITIRVGQPAAAPQPRQAAAEQPRQQPQQPQQPGGKVLTRGAEALRLDTNYANRDGYDAGFIPGFRVPMPDLGQRVAGELAPLRAGEPDAAGGELKYQHFSVKMNGGKRMAIFTATNVDGGAYLAVSRTTGLVSDNSEGETWFKDRRISQSFYLDQPFYSEWSTYFDRGHLTRRTDPTWGTPQDAERANADTFHFTNCSPQHFRFNQTIKYWQGAERYVLENGLLAADSGRHISVIQGPIFDDAIDRWADDVQIPSSFFKVIAWRGETGRKAVGLIVDQLPLLGERRVNLGPPRDVPHVDVSEWRYSVRAIERRTGLEFDRALHDADTIGANQPHVGAEAARPIRSFADLLA